MVSVNTASLHSLTNNCSCQVMFSFLLGQIFESRCFLAQQQHRITEMASSAEISGDFLAQPLCPRQGLLEPVAKDQIRAWSLSQAGVTGSPVFCPPALDAAEGTETLENLYVWSPKSPYRSVLMCSLVLVSGM